MLGDISEEYILDASEADALWEKPDLSLVDVDSDTEEDNDTAEDDSAKQNDNIDTPEESEEEETEDDGEEVKEDTEDTVPIESLGASPDLYSSLASTLREVGVFPDLEDEEVAKASSPEDFVNLIRQQIQAGLDERQKRIDEALNAGVEPTLIQRLEDDIKYFEGITENMLTSESDQALQVRRALIINDKLKRGFTKERAEKIANNAIENNDDIEDARESLKNLKEYCHWAYDQEIQKAKKIEDDKKKQLEDQNKAMQNFIINDGLMTSIIESKKERQKVWDVLSTPKVKTEDGRYLTELQKYSEDHPVEFAAYMASFYTLTDGFKDLGKVFKTKVNKEFGKSMREFENKLKSSGVVADKNVRYVSGASSEDNTWSGNLKVMF